MKKSLIKRASHALTIFGVLCGLNVSSRAAAASEADMKILKERVVASVVLTTPNVLQKAVDEARKQSAQLKPDGSWPDIDYADQTPGGWKPNAHLRRLQSMAQALNSPGSPLFNDAQLHAQTLLALRAWLQKDPKSSNWWHNQIGAPQQLGEIALLLENSLTPDDKTGIIRVLDRALLSQTKANLKTGQNLVWLARNQIFDGLLRPDPELIASSFQAIWDEVKIARAGAEGVQADWSFHQHGVVLYSGGYGAGFTSDTARTAVLARDTPFAMPADKQKIIEAYLLDGQAWMMRGGRWDLGVKGREIVRQGVGSSAVLLGAARNLATLPNARKPELAAFIARFEKEDGAFQGNRHFYASDFMAHHRAGYYASVRMYSTRMDNTDSLTNDENKKSHHIADGANILMRRGDEYQEIFPVWDWQKIPGTTVDQNPAPLDPKKVRVKGQSAFVGGVSDGSHGAAAMQLKRDQLAVRKAWFFFDDEYICLGAGITDSSPNVVVTSVNQCNLKGEVTTPNGTISGAADLSGTNWVRHDGVNYLFPNKTNVQATIGAQSGKWGDIGTSSKPTVTTNVFNLWIDHGVKPQDATYAYIVRPTDSGPPTADAISNIEILSNTSDLQAVRQSKLKLTGVVFARAGQVAFDGTTLSVDQPCLLLCRQVPAGFAVSVSNPENKALKVRVELTRGASKTQTTFDLPNGLQAGSSVTQIIK